MRAIPRTRSNDGAAPRAHHSTAGKGRGWQVLREQWKDFLHRRPGIPSRVLSDMPRSEPSAHRTDLSKEASDRILEKITTQCSSDSPRSVARVKTWKKAKQVESEFKAMLSEAGWKPPPPPPPERSLMEKDLSALDLAAERLFPRDWWNVCNEEVLAEMVIDSFVGKFCDAFLDSAIALVEANYMAPQRTQGSLSHSASAPSLRPARTWRPARNAFEPLPISGSLTLQSTIRSQSQSQSFEHEQGFPMAGLQKGSHDAWTIKQYHKCSPLEPIKTRIKNAADAQRPTRRRVPSRTAKPDLPEFNFPMTATNFPEAWEKTTRRKVVGSRQGAPQSEESSLYSIGKDGKTMFPYSLALHKAFLESQPDPVLKEKAMKVAPLRLTTDW